MVEIKIAGVRPMFAHEVLISTVFRSKKEEDGKIKKEVDTEMIFVDMATKQVVSRVVIPLSVLESLPEVITKKISEIKKELKNKEMPKKPKIEEISNKNYLG